MPSSSSSGKEVPLATLPMDDLDTVMSWTKKGDLAGGVLPAPLSRRSNLSVRADRADVDTMGTARIPSSVLPRTLVCHDMKGGYLEDRFVYGADGLKNPPYALTAWSAVDAFVYFSHHFVTVPPVGWTSAAHLHGVRSMGTIITEWAAGKEKCDAFLKSEHSRRALANKLAEIAAESGFDGWLVNVENELDGEKQADEMALFVGELTVALHARVPGSLVVWYDAVTVEGKLEWQNELNGKNAKFFSACDGIFLNYTWKAEEEDFNSGDSGQHIEPLPPPPVDNLKNSLDYLKATGDEARRPQVYVGVDVFGRGCLGGGGFNTKEALEAVRSHGLSAALFAPAWTHERATDPSDPVALDSREQAFWELLRPHLNLRGPILPDAPCSFSSGFGRGFGREAESGLEEASSHPHPVISFEASGGWRETPPPSLPTASKRKGGGGGWWLDMTRQEFQSSFLHPHPSWPEGAGTTRLPHDYCLFSAADGGGGVCLRVPAASSSDQEGARVKVPLLLFEFKAKEEESVLYFVVVVSGEGKEASGGDLGLAARTADVIGEGTEEALTGFETETCRRVDDFESKAELKAIVEREGRRGGDAGASCFELRMKPGRVAMAAALVVKRSSAGDDDVMVVLKRFVVFAL